MARPVQGFHRSQVPLLTEQASAVGSDGVVRT